MSAPYKPRKAGSFKEACAILVSACGGNGAAGALLGGVSAQHVARATDSDHRERLSVEQVVALEATARRPVVTAWMAEQSGCIVEAVAGIAADPLAVVVGRITSETGDVLSAAARDMMAGKLTRANAVNVLKQTDELLPAILELRAGARAALEAAP